MKFNILITAFPFVNEYKKLPIELQDIFADDMLIEMIDSMVEAELIKRIN